MPMFVPEAKRSPPPEPALWEGPVKASAWEAVTSAVTTLIANHTVLFWKNICSKFLISPPEACSKGASALGGDPPSADNV